MASLQINPSSYEISFLSSSVQDCPDLREISARLSTEGPMVSGVVTYKECVAISRFFTKVSKEIMAAEKKAKAQAKKNEQ